MSLSTLEVLKMGKALLTPRTWCKGAYAYAPVGGGRMQHCHPTFHEATEWCGIGATYAQGNKASTKVIDAAVLRLNYAANKLYPKDFGKNTMAKVNDSYNSTLPMIHAIYDEAIAAENLYLKEGRDI